MSWTADDVSRRSAIGMLVGLALAAAILCGIRVYERWPKRREPLPALARPEPSEEDLVRSLRAVLRWRTAFTTDAGRKAAKELFEETRDACRRTRDPQGLKTRLRAGVSESAAEAEVDALLAEVFD